MTHANVSYITGQNSNIQVCQMESNNLVIQDKRRHYDCCESIKFHNWFKTQNYDWVNHAQMFEFHADQVHKSLHFLKMPLHMAAYWFGYKEWHKDLPMDLKTWPIHRMWNSESRYSLWTLKTNFLLIVQPLHQRQHFEEAAQGGEFHIFISRGWVSSRILKGVSQFSR